MTNLDSISRSIDFTLPTKVCLVKAMVFPVVMFGCESWTVKKAERRRIDGFEHIQFQSSVHTLHYSASLKVRLVKAMVFPVVMYGCERWKEI